jgi:diaminopimelate decarboxylase
MRNQIEFARDIGVRLTVFDSEAELHKLASVPVAAGQRFRLLLRIATDDKDSICRFSNKFGALPSEAPGLLVTAKRLGLDVVGVSFHVGSGCGDATAYTTAMGHASDIFATARQLGFSPLSVVDIGGGFPGGATGVQVGMPSFADLAAVIRAAIAAFEASHGSASGNGTDLSFIAEPGRFFVSDATTAVTRVYARKGADTAADAADFGPQAVYVDDGVYGTFNNVIYDHALPVPCKVPLQQQQQQECEQEQQQQCEQEQEEELIPSAVFGPTCDGLDQLCHADTTLLPRLQEGDWLMWADMGAYTHTASFVFNGYTHFPNNHFVQ